MLICCEEHSFPEDLLCPSGGDRQKRTNNPGEFFYPGLCCTLHGCHAWAAEQAHVSTGMLYRRRMESKALHCHICQRSEAACCMNVGHKGTLLQGWWEEAWTPCVLDAKTKLPGTSKRKAGPTLGSHVCHAFTGVISEGHISRQENTPS